MSPSQVPPMLAIIPARGGSKGLPGKNVRRLGGLPLIAHSIRMAAGCKLIARTVLSTDSEEIAAVGREHGADVPFLRPAELAEDDTPMWPVLQHALKVVEAADGVRYGSVLLLDPTSPGRACEDVKRAVAMLEEDASAVGVIAVSQPHFNPRWVCVEGDEHGYMRKAFSDTQSYSRRQDVPPVYRINGCLYLWRRDYLAESATMQLHEARHHMLVMPEERAVHIDELHDFQMAEILLREGMIQFPWLK